MKVQRQSSVPCGIVKNSRALDHEGTTPMVIRTCYLKLLCSLLWPFSNFVTTTTLTAIDTTTNTNKLSSNPSRPLLHNQQNSIGNILHSPNPLLRPRSFQQIIKSFSLTLRHRRIRRLRMSTRNEISEDRSWSNTVYCYVMRLAKLDYQLIKFSSEGIGRGKYVLHQPK
jgi:hypothetical protein